MHHVVARWFRVALGACCRAGRWMNECRDSPFRRRVTLQALAAKIALVPVFGRMATGAAEGSLRRSLPDLVLISIATCIHVSVRGFLDNFFRRLRYFFHQFEGRFDIGSRKIAGTGNLAIVL